MKRAGRFAGRRFFGEPISRRYSEANRRGQRGIGLDWPVFNRQGRPANITAALLGRPITGGIRGNKICAFDRCITIQRHHHLPGPGNQITTGRKGVFHQPQERGHRYEPRADSIRPFGNGRRAGRLARRPDRQHRPSSYSGRRRTQRRRAKGADSDGRSAPPFRQGTDGSDGHASRGTAYAPARARRLDAYSACAAGHVGTHHHYGEISPAAGHDKTPALRPGFLLTPEQCSTIDRAAVPGTAAYVAAKARRHANATGTDTERIPLLVAVIVGMVLRGLMRVVRRMQAMGVGGMRMMAALIVVAGRIMLGSLTMMMRGVLVMLGRGFVMFLVLVRTHLTAPCF